MKENFEKSTSEHQNIAMARDKHERLSPLREKIHDVIFEAETPAGRAFDIGLIILILFSVVTVMAESVKELQEDYGTFFIYTEYLLTAIFTVEYVLRLWVVRSPMKYATSFFGVVDLLAILPVYIVFFLGGTSFFIVIRALRLMRIFRIFKLGHFMNEGYVIVEAMKASRMKISVFLFFILILVTIIGSVMYVVEGESNPGFTSIPRAIYWAIVTLTTVGFGDIVPKTQFGQFLSAVVMILGYAVIAVPTGIVSSEFIKNTKSVTTESCHNCGAEGHDSDADYCKYCGVHLHPERFD